MISFARDCNSKLKFTSSIISFSILIIFIFLFLHKLNSSYSKNYLLLLYQSGFCPVFLQVSSSSFIFWLLCSSSLLWEDHQSISRFTWFIITVSERESIVDGKFHTQWNTIYDKSNNNVYICNINAYHTQISKHVFFLNKAQLYSESLEISAASKGLMASWWSLILLFCSVTYIFFFFFERYYRVLQWWL